MVGFHSQLSFNAGAGVPVRSPGTVMILGGTANDGGGSDMSSENGSGLNTGPGKSRSPSGIDSNVGVSDSDLEPVLELARVSGIASGGAEMRLHGIERDNDWASPDHLSVYGVL